MEKLNFRQPTSARIFTPKNLPAILRSMADYAEQCIDDEEVIGGYFLEIVESGLFHDSEGKVLEADEESCTVAIDY